LYIEAMEQVLSNTTKVFVDQKGGSVMYLPIDKLVAPAERNVNVPMEPEADTEAAPGAGRTAPRTRSDLRRRGG
jgi:membrane protease subunit HflK